MPSLNRYIKISITLSDNTVISNYTNDFGISVGTLNLEEILCESEFKLGEICSSKFEVEIFNLDDDITNASIVVESITDNISTPIFSGIIESSTFDNFNNSRQITAYDRIYFLRDKDVGSWWNTFWTNKTTSTIYDLRVALFLNVGLTTETVSLPNDNLVIKQYMTVTDTTSVSVAFGELARMICEINGCFGHIGRDGIFKYVYLGTTAKSIVSTNYEKTSVEFEDYTTDLITGINIYESSDALMRSYGVSTNAYAICGNIFTFTVDNYTQLDTVCANILDKIDDIQYIPCEIPLIISDLSLQLGDKIQTEKGIHYIMSQTYSGSLLVDQSIKCNAYGEVLNQNVSDANNIIVTNKKISYIKQTQDLIETRVETVEADVEDIQSGAVFSVDVLYAKGDSSTVAPTTGWSTTAPTWESGKYIWQKTKSYHGDGTSSESNPTCIQGAKGEDGEEGKGIDDIKEQYYLSTSNTEQTGGSWLDTCPLWEENKYIWTRSYITWNDSTTSTTTPVLASALNEANQTAKSTYTLLTTSYSTTTQTDSAITSAVSASRTQIMGDVANTYATQASLSLYVTTESAQSNVVSWINASADNIVLNTKSLIFGVYPSGQYIEVKNYYEDSTAKGVLFDGTGEIMMESTGQFCVKNLDSDDNIVNMFTLSSTEIELRNKGESSDSYIMLDTDGRFKLYSKGLYLGNEYNSSLGVEMGYIDAPLLLIGGNNVGTTNSIYIGDTDKSFITVNSSSILAKSSFGSLLVSDSILALSTSSGGIGLNISSTGVIMSYSSSSCYVMASSVGISISDSASSYINVYSNGITLYNSKVTIGSDSEIQLNSDITINPGYDETIIKGNDLQLNYGEYNDVYIGGRYSEVYINYKQLVFNSDYSVTWTY